VNKNASAFAALAAAAILFMMPLATARAHAASSLTISFDKTAYRAGEVVTVTGKAPSPDPIVIQIYNPNGDPYRVDQISPGASGNYTYKFKVGGPLAVNGEFKVTVAYLDSVAEGKFTLTGGKEPPKKPEPDMFNVTAKATGNTVKIAIKSDKKAKAVSKVVFQVDKDLGKAKIRAPAKWKAEVSGNTVTFSTASKPVKGGKTIILTIPSVKTLSWQTFSGSTELEKGTLALG
jgi:uncharacterized protein YfaS (alpha-2-macroglobulin family)